jgi:hypothetical protein
MNRSTQDIERDKRIGATLEFLLDSRAHSAHELLIRCDF